jgi:hypothetical protein
MNLAFRLTLIPSESALRLRHRALDLRERVDYIEKPAYITVRQSYQ